jgi:S1-C subfamily serine protease
MSGSGRTGPFILTAVAALLLACQGAVLALPPAEKGHELEDGSEPLTRVYASLNQLYEKVSPGVLRIIVRNALNEGHSGTGFYVSKDGLIATNWHVIRLPGLSSIRLEMPDAERVKADVLAIDPEADLVILKPRKPVVPGHVFSGRYDPPLRIGDETFTIGYPKGLRLSFSRGVVSGIRTAAEVRAACRLAGTLKHSYNYVQTDAGIDPGNSGGPLLDGSGHVLGVCTLRPPDTSLGFAIEYQALHDLCQKAATSKPLDLAVLRALIDEAPATGHSAATTPAEVAAAAREARKCIYCMACGGTGVAKAPVASTAAVVGQSDVTPGDSGRGLDPWEGPRTSATTKLAAGPCAECGGGGVTRNVELLQSRLSRLVHAIAWCDTSLPGGPAAYRNAMSVIDEAAFRDARYAQALTRPARQVLDSPQKNYGNPAVFVGRIHSVTQQPSGSFLLVWPLESTQLVVVAFPGKVTAVKGQRCLVAGLMAGRAETMPVVGAVRISGLHGNPKHGRPKSHSTPLLAGSAGEGVGW